MPCSRQEGALILDFLFSYTRAFPEYDSLIAKIGQLRSQREREKESVRDRERRIEEEGDGGRNED